MFERYGEQARDRKFSVMTALCLLAIGAGFVFYGAWAIGLMFVALAVIFGIPPFLFGKERFERTMHVLSWIGTFGWLG